ncbi:DMT family transporter [Amycolatopsis sp. ATCC 39116]|uniref:DMT family transporter n=1 Tax=Amycolatopsis sp. (strain ATCC 39116 / 75iv2) TaxID=385957 RepID=UPI00026264F2|nr:DMT family transporter [Amycolatopsis sp. ATCC 39116]
MLTVLLAVLAAVANAAGAVLQRAGARKQQGSDLDVGALKGLVRTPVWVAGVVVMLTGLVLQAAALATGPIVLIQPIMVSELAVTLVLAGLVFRTRLGVRDSVAAVGMAVSVGLLLFALAPGGGDTRGVSALEWLLGCAVTITCVAVLFVAGKRDETTHSAAFLGAAAGLWFGFTAVLMAGVTAALTAGGVPGLFKAWQTYAMLVAGPAGFFLLQTALRAGRLVAAQPGLVLANPLVALGWGLLVFGEHVRGGPWIALELVAAGGLAGCTVLLAGSPLLRDEDPAPQPA